MGTSGEPRDQPFAAYTERTPIPIELGTIADMAPIPEDASGPTYLLLTERELIRFNAATSECVRLAGVDVPAEPESARKPWGDRRRRLHVCARGEFAAVVNDYGRYGQVLDLRSGQPTMALDGGDYHPQTVPFSLAFAAVRGRTVLVHRTDWNRLDISDPSTGALLTERGPTSFGQDEQQPEHYLDFFHGALHVSPRSQRILDDGWVWQPMGVLRTWRLEPWLLENPWESEDGASGLDVCVRDDWCSSATWLDEDRFAIYGLGEESDKMVPGARIFDAASGGPASPEYIDHGRWARELGAFPGPAGSFFSDGAWLFSSEPTHLRRWDVTTGAQTGEVPGFAPTHFHRGAREFAQLVGRTLVRVGI